MQQLRDDAAQAAQRAASAEVKVEVLQKAVQQAEERAAALEMQVRGRASHLLPSDWLPDPCVRPGRAWSLKALPSEGLVLTGHACMLQVQSRTGLVEEMAEGSQAPGGSREGDLRNQIKMLREELTSAQETAAAAAGHAKQYESLAKSSDEAVKAMQVWVSSAHKRSLEPAAISTRVWWRILGGDAVWAMRHAGPAAEVQGGVRGARRVHQEGGRGAAGPAGRGGEGCGRAAPAACCSGEAGRGCRARGSREGSQGRGWCSTSSPDGKGAAMTVRTALKRSRASQAHLAEIEKERHALQLRVGRQQADIEQLRNQYRTAQQNYDRQACT